MLRRGVAPGLRSACAPRRPLRALVRGWVSKGPTEGEGEPWQDVQLWVKVDLGNV